MNGKPASLTLPDLSSFRRQLVRHEIIALHLAVTLGGAEFYPSWTRIRVGDSQTGTPNQTTSIPGAYNDNNLGIYDPSAYSPGAPYTFPCGPWLKGQAGKPCISPAELANFQETVRRPLGVSRKKLVLIVQAKNGKPTSTNGASTGSGPQPTGIAQSSLNRICKP